MTLIRALGDCHGRRDPDPGSRTLPPGALGLRPRGRKILLAATTPKRAVVVEDTRQMLVSPNGKPEVPQVTAIMAMPNGVSRIWGPRKTLCQRLAGNPSDQRRNHRNGYQG